MSDDLDWISHHMSQIDALVAEFGWAVQGVPATSSSPSLVYTVGLAEKDKPECVIVGLPLEVAQLIINDIAPMLPLAEGTIVEDVANLPLRIDYLHETQVERMLPAANLRADRTVEAVQLVWPDKGGAYPDDPAFDAEMARFQPLLRRPYVSPRKAEADGDGTTTPSTTTDTASIGAPAETAPAEG